MLVRVIGIDPGPTHSGFALLEYSDNEIMLDSFGDLTNADIRSNLIPSEFDGSSIFAVEFLRGGSGFGSLLIDTAFETGRMVQSAIHVINKKGKVGTVINEITLPAVLHPSAQFIKRFLTGQNNCTKKIVHQVIKGKLPGSFRAGLHVFDAIAVGLTVLHSDEYLNLPITDSIIGVK